MFSPEERSIFKYHNGEKEIWADPLAIRRQLTLAFGGDPDAALDAAQPPVYVKAPDGSEPPVNPVAEVHAARGLGRLMEGVREAFGMTPFDPDSGKGATEEQCMKALQAYLDFLESKKKLPEDSPTPSTLTEQPSSPSSGSPASATSSGSA